MCLKYRMSTNNSGSKPSEGFLNKINVFGLFGNKNSSKNNTAKNGMNVININSKNNTSKNVMPASTGVPTVPVTTGGMAPVNFRYGANMQQPSEEVMKWATTAGAPMPPAAMMRNVAHGGSRRNRNRRNKSRKGGSRRNRNKSLRNKSRKGGSKRKSQRNKRRSGSRRNRRN